MVKIKINNVLYPASIITINNNRDFDGRDTKKIYLSIAIEDAKLIFVDDLQWSIVEGHMEDETYVIDIEIDQSDYCKAGELVDYRNGQISALMAKLTDKEIIEILTGGN